MPKFIKDDSNESKTVIVNDTKLEKEVSSPFYFPPLEDQLKQGQVALMFNRSNQTICNWTKSNKIPFFQIGDHPIYSRKQLVLFAAKNQSLISNK